jgi:hypothetical protein
MFRPVPDAEKALIGEEMWWDIYQMGLLRWLLQFAFPFDVRVAKSGAQTWPASFEIPLVNRFDRINPA